MTTALVVQHGYNVYKNLISPVIVNPNALNKQAREENPLPVVTEKKRGRKKKGKILALVERLDKYKASVCLLSITSWFRSITTKLNVISE